MLSDVPPTQKAEGYGYKTEIIPSICIPSSVIFNMKFFSAAAFFAALVASGSACIGGGGGGQCCPPAQPGCSNPCQGAGPQYAAAPPPPPQYAAPPAGGYPTAGK